MISYHKGAAAGDLLDVSNNPSWGISVSDDFQSGGQKSISPKVFADKLKSAANLENRDLIQKSNGNEIPARWIMETIANGKIEKSPFLHPRKYPELLEMVGRFDVKAE